MGLGLRSGTLRNRIRALRRYFTWPATSHQVAFPKTEEHMLDYLELKFQEPCTCVALKVVHQSLVYLEEISKISPAVRLTVRPRCSNLLAELLSQTRPGAEPKQAARPLVRVFEAIERTVVDYREPVFVRLYAWFYLLQTWCSLRSDDHRELEPGLLRNSETSLTGVLTRSKRHGPDNRILRKPAFLDKNCWFEVKNWCDVGFDLLQELALYERDYLLPSPGQNHGGIGEAEMSYDAGLATTTRLHSGLVADGQQLPDRSWPLAVQHWESQRQNETLWAGRRRTSQTPAFGSNAHSSRNFSFLSCQSSLVATTSARSWEKESRCKNWLLSWRRQGWTESGSRSNSPDLTSRRFREQHLFRQALEAQPLQLQVDTLEEGAVRLGPVQEEEADAVVRRQPGRQACANIKESRAQSLKELPDGFHVCEAGRFKARRSHRLEYCWMVPRVDYLVYSYKGPHMPREREYEEVQALQCSVVHTNAARQWILAVSLSHHPLLSLFFSSDSRLGVSATIKFVSVRLEGLSSLTAVGYDQVSICSSEESRHLSGF